MTTSVNSPGMQKSLPTSYYLSEEVFARKERIFFREWFCAGREEQIPRPGDHLVLDVLGESVLVVRTKQGELRAHYNVCAIEARGYVVAKRSLRKSKPEEV